MTTRLSTVRMFIRSPRVGTLVVGGASFLISTIATIVGGACDGQFAIDLECGICQQIGPLANQKHFGPSWTADGETVVFGYRSADQSLAHVGGYSHHIYIVSSDGARLTRWIPLGAPPDDTLAFDYSPDLRDSKVAFATLRHARKGDRLHKIAIAELDGSGYRRMTDNDGSDLTPAWSPDGSRIAFTSNRAGFASKKDDLDGAAFNVYVMDADGSNVRGVAPNLFVSPHQPKWSPDGGYLEPIQQPRWRGK